MPALGADLQYPIAVAVGSDGATYVADPKLPGIWKIVEGKPEIFFAGQKKFRTPLNAVRCLAVDEKGKLLAGDSATRDIYRFDEPGKPVPLTGGSIGIPAAIAVNGKGEIFVADLETQRVFTVPPAGGTPVEFGHYPSLRGLALDTQERLWIVTSGAAQLLRVAPDGKVETIVTERTFHFPQQIAVDAKGTAFVSDGYGKVIWKVDETGKPQQWARSDAFRNPQGLAWREARLLVADPQAGQIFAVDPQGQVTPIVKPATPSAAVPPEKPPTDPPAAK